MPSIAVKAVSACDLHWTSRKLAAPYLSKRKKRGFNDVELMRDLSNIKLASQASGSKLDFFKLEVNIANPEFHEKDINQKDDKARISFRWKVSFRNEPDNVVLYILERKLEYGEVQLVSNCFTCLTCSDKSDDCKHIAAVKKFQNKKEIHKRR
jgi:hypothetical protein